jgi:phospholipid/cholesterol/gamma-HCH transport system permease protein
MNATVQRPPYERPGAPSPTGLARLAHGFADPVRDQLIELGQMGSFIVRAFVEMRGVFRYTSEAIRQIAILITGSVVVLLTMQFIMGLSCGNESVYVMRGYGASSYAGVFSALCTIRETIPFMFMFMIGAKIGTGYVAELGAMRLNDEIDAMESLGINPMRYVVATRLLANILISIPVYILGVALAYFATYIVIVAQVGEISYGTWKTVHWAFSDAGSIFYTYLQVLFVWVYIVLASMYYGFNVRGGPVGVGVSTAKAMVVALVMSMILHAGFTYFFFGVDPRIAVGG